MNVKTQVSPEPGSRQALTFINIHENKAGTTAYVWFDDAQEVRRFDVSQEFLKFSDCFDKDWTSQLRLKGEMTFIRDEFTDGDAPEKCPLSIDQIDLHAVPEKHKYSNKEQAQSQRRLSHLLILMADTFRPGGTSVSDIDGGENDLLTNLTGRSGRNHVEHVSVVPGAIHVICPTLMPRFDETDLRVEMEVMSKIHDCSLARL